MMLRFHTIATLASIAVVAAASSTGVDGGDDGGNGGELTFFDRNFGYPNVMASASAVITTRNEQQQQQQQQQQQVDTSNNTTSSTSTTSSNSNTTTNSSSSSSSSSSSKSPTKSATTPAPSLQQQQQQQSQSQPPSSLASMPALCEHQPWAEICKPWFTNNTATTTTLTTTDSPTTTATDSPTTTTNMPTFYPSTMAPTTYEPTTYAPTTFAPTTDQPTLNPTVEFTLISEIAILESEEDVDGGNGNAGNTTTGSSSNTTNANNNDGNTTANNDGNATSTTNNSTSGNNTSSSSSNTTTTTNTTADDDGSGYLVNVSYSYKLTPMDDTFLEVYRPKEPLGSKTKLKADAEQEWIEDDDTIAADNAARIPTKFIQLKFGLRTVLQEMRNAKWLLPLTSDTFELQLKSATLHLFALTSSSFGGYVTAVLPNSENPGGGGGVVIAEGWDEESAVWSDYVKGAGGGPGGGGGGRGGKKILPNDKNPELSHISGPVVANKWYTADVSSAILDMMKLYDEEMADLGDDDDDDDAANIGPKNEDFVMKTKSLTLRISTNSTDGIIYASKEHPSGVGPYLELEFVGLNARTFTSSPTTEPSGPCGLPMSMCTDTPSTASSSIKPSMSPSSTTIPVMDEPDDPEQENETNASPTEENVEAEVVNTTSVVSSSFRMTITAIESIGGRRNLASLLRHGHANPRVLKGETESSSTTEQQQLPQPTLLQKEEPSIMEHLLRVYNEVLTIPPIDLSLVYEEDLEVEYMSADAKQDAGGVIRTSVFRIMAVFDQPEVSSMLSNDAAKVLDEATIYAFVGPEEEEFVTVFKNTGDPIVAGADTAEYDVTVLKVKYSKEDEEDVSSSSANREDSNSDANEDTTSSSSNAWLHPTLIAGASAICLASSAAAVLLWRQRRSGEYYSDNDQKKANDSPRSFGEATVPTTPSPTGLLLASFKSKKRFDYSEFDDDGMDAENPSDAMVIPLTATDNNVLEQPSTIPQPTDNIKFPDAQNVSFDDSSVSDVSAHVLGAKGNHRRIDNYGTQAESLLLDQSMDSGYNMETMSALEQVRFENVLDVDGYSLTSSKQRNNGGAGVGGIRKVASEDTYGEDGSLSTGAVPSEMYSQMSMDDSLVYSHDNNSAAGGGDGEAVAYAGHLFTLDMLRNKDKSLLVMPPPPSDIASDTSSQKDDLEEDYDIMVESNIGIEHAPMREKDEQESVSQSITDELTKVMRLLRSDDQSAGYTSMDESVMHIGTVAGHHTVADQDAPASSDNAEPPAAEDDACYDGLNVLMNDGPIVNDGDGDNDVNEDPNDNTNHYLTEMNEAVSDCMDILDKAQMQNRELSIIGDDAIPDKEVAVGTTVTVAVVDDESSLVTQTLD